MKEVTDQYKKYTTNKLVNDRGVIIVNKEETKDIWKKYIKELFDGNRPDPLPPN